MSRANMRGSKYMRRAGKGNSKERKKPKQSPVERAISEELQKSLSWVNVKRMVADGIESQLNNALKRVIAREAVKSKKIKELEEKVVSLKARVADLEGRTIDYKGEQYLESMAIRFARIELD